MSSRLLLPPPHIKKEPGAEAITRFIDSHKESIQNGFELAKTILDNKYAKTASLVFLATRVSQNPELTHLGFFLSLGSFFYSLKKGTEQQLFFLVTALSYTNKEHFKF